MTTIPLQLAALDRLVPQIEAHLVLIDDASSDATALSIRRLQRTQSRHRTRIHVVSRHLPAAQVGKGAALNQAVAMLRQFNHRPLSATRTIVGVIDADGFISTTDLQRVITTFNQGKFSMVQTNIAMTNPRENLLTRMQNFEFLGINAFMQEARNRIGAAIASGNGQFMTLKMVQATGWGNSLLEDFEFTVRGLFNGFHGVFLPEATVYQEAVTHWAALIKQRTRWCTGSMQCLVKYFKLIVTNHRIPSRVKADLLVFLMLPFFAMVLLMANVVSLAVQVYKLFQPHPAGVIISLVLILGLALSLWAILANEYRLTTQTTWHQTLILSWQALVYNAGLSVIPYLAFFKLLRHNNHWDKTVHQQAPVAWHELPMAFQPDEVSELSRARIMNHQ